MFKKYKKIVYAAAILAGIVGVAGGGWGHIFDGMLYFLLGVIFGFFWPKEQWRWGLYLSLPVTGLIMLSILFSGIGGAIENDLFFILASLTGSTAGSFIGSLIGMKYRRVS